MRKVQKAVLALKRKEYVIVKKTLKAISVINVKLVIGVILHVMVNINIYFLHYII